jgi:hypothetical protein
VDTKNTADPRHDIKVFKVIEKSLRLSGVDWGDPPAGIAGADVRKDVPHAVAAEQIGKLLDLEIVSE